jgi:hypothetical protein
MKNFDADLVERTPRDDRMFVLRGQTFVVRDRVRPDVLIPIDSLREQTVSRTDCTCGHERRFHVSPTDRTKIAGCNDPTCDGCEQFTGVVEDPGSTLTEQLAAYDETIVSLIEDADDAHTRYAAVRAQEDQALTADDLLEVIRWAAAVAGGRPTGDSSVSTNGHASTVTTSTEPSSSPVTPAAQTDLISGS